MRRSGKHHANGRGVSNGRAAARDVQDAQNQGRQNRASQQFHGDASEQSSVARLRSKPRPVLVAFEEFPAIRFSDTRDHGIDSAAMICRARQMESSTAETFSGSENGLMMYDLRATIGSP